MSTVILNRWCLILACWVFGLLTAVVVRAQPSILSEVPYTFDVPSRGGIGKFYLGREIAQVMGHRGAIWLERKTRTAEERSDLVVQGMELTPGAKVADIGAGTGYFTFRIAPSVPTGRVYAVDIQPEML